MRPQRLQGAPHVAALLEGAWHPLQVADGHQAALASMVLAACRSHAAKPCGEHACAAAQRRACTCMRIPWHCGVHASMQAEETPAPCMMHLQACNRLHARMRPAITIMTSAQHSTAQASAQSMPPAAWHSRLKHIGRKGAGPPQAASCCIWIRMEWTRPGQEAARASHAAHSRPLVASAMTDVREGGTHAHACTSIHQRTAARPRALHYTR